MTEDELVQEIKERSQDLSRRTNMWEHFHIVNSPEALRAGLEFDAQRRAEGRSTGFPDPVIPAPTTSEAVRSAEKAIGFVFPPLLGRL